MISPTGLQVRSDIAGDGRYGSPRGSRIHKGTDFLCHPIQPLVFPCAYGKVTRFVQAYADTTAYQGVEFNVHDYAHGDLVLKVLYCIPFDIIGQLSAGQVFGFAQDISERYPNQGMRPHIHVEVRKEGQLVDPELILERRY